MSRLELYLLGPPHVELDANPLHLPRRKALAFLAYLAVTGRPHSRDSLAALFWPQHDRRSARAELSRTLSTLNRSLGQGTLVADRATAGLDLGADVWLDSAAFRERLSSAAAAGSDAERLPLLVEAVALYRDSFLAGFTLRDSAPFDEWQFFETQGLQDELAGALERLAHAHSQREEAEQSIWRGGRVVSAGPGDRPRLGRSAHDLPFLVFPELDRIPSGPGGTGRTPGARVPVDQTAARRPGQPRPWA